MALQLSISAENDLQTIASGAGSDILDLYLNTNNASTTRHIKLDMLRNCCSSGVITQYYAPRYILVPTNISEVEYIGTGVNDRVMTVRLVGIDASYIDNVVVQTNADNPDTLPLVSKVYTGAEITGDGFEIYFSVGQSPTILPGAIVITTIDGYTYSISMTYNWTLDVRDPTGIAGVTTFPDFPPLGTVSLLTNITFTPSDWGISTTDGKYLDGNYSYSLTQVEIGTDVVESVGTFYQIQLKCLVTTYLSNNTQDTIIGVMMAALEAADECNLSESQKCALYERIIRLLILANQVKSNSKLGCNCGCK